ncbi:MAG: MraY family glycosyltransferase [Candidatus Promineifilaceae bacterium]
MLIFIAIFFIALAATAVGTPQVRRLAQNLGFVDVPGGRKTQEQPIPLLGGLAIIGGMLLAVTLFFFVFYGRLPRPVAGVLLASAVVAAVGLIDDRQQLPFWTKLAGELCGTVILIYFGIHVQLPLPAFVNYAITIVWILGISNAVNFLDNMDGLSTGISAVAASFILLLAVVQGQFLVAAMAAALLGATLGFLRYNFFPAEIYMGDAGSLFLGFMLAVLTMQLRFPENSNMVTWMVPVFILFLPIFDMALVVFSRLRRRVSPNTAGHDHVSHRLVARDYTPREAVLILYLVAGTGGMLAVYITQAGIIDGYLIGILTAVLAIAFIWRLDKNFAP